MPSIDTLAADIQNMFGQTLEGTSTSLEEELLAKFGADVAMHIADALRARTGGRKERTLYPSEIGTPCLRKLWYAHNQPELGEKMQDHTLYKFLYGNLVEETTLLLAEAAGHTVEGRQARRRYPLVGGWAVSGRIDAVIDGVLVDVKSCSPYGFKKFESGLTDDNDSFGYRTQLNVYNGLSVPEFDRQGFLAVDKQNGHVGFFEYPWESSEDRVTAAVMNITSPSPPARQFDPIPEGRSGNMKLCVECSYCPYKAVCWEGLKAYAYSFGPVFFTDVKRIPNVAEIPLKIAA